MNGFMNLIKAVVEPIEAVADVAAEAVKAETKPVTDGCARWPTACVRSPRGRSGEPPQHQQAPPPLASEAAADAQAAGHDQARGEEPAVSALGILCWFGIHHWRHDDPFSYPRCGRCDKLHPSVLRGIRR